MTERNPRIRAAAILVFVAAISSSCGAVLDDNRISFVDADAQLTCTQPNSQGLAAQSVKTAALVPCIEELPSGWKFEGTSYRSDGVTIDFDSSRPPVSDLRIDFRESCVAASGVVTADTPSFDFEAAELLLPPGATFNRESIAGSPVPGLRVVTFGSGFCLEFTIEFEANEPIGFEDFPMVSFVDRSVLDEATKDATDGRLELDP
ncbi:MAG: hypothetical protein GY708_16325 [Actinomycetia bacterium]|nr:hypothetical protein [Actinomycetes bacterium]